MSKGRTVPPQPPFDIPQAALDMVQRPGLTMLEYWHDHDCPAGRTQRMDDCTCEPSVKLVRPFDNPPHEVTL